MAGRLRSPRHRDNRRSRHLDTIRGATSSAGKVSAAVNYFLSQLVHVPPVIAARAADQMVEAVVAIADEMEASREGVRR